MQPIHSVYTSNAYPGQFPQTTAHYSTYEQSTLSHGAPVYRTAVPTTTIISGPSYSTGTVINKEVSVQRSSYHSTWNSSWVSPFSRYGEADLHNLFNKFDRDMSGFITFDELRNMYNEMGTPISDAALAYLQTTYDANRDGRLSFPEFYEFMSGKPYSGVVTSAPVYTTQSYSTRAPVYATQSYTSSTAPVYTSIGAPFHSTQHFSSGGHINTNSDHRFSNLHPATTVTTTTSGYSTGYQAGSLLQRDPSWAGPLGHYNDADLRRMFSAFDIDGSGFITFLELQNMYRQCGTPISPSALTYLQATYDRNRDGRLSYPEFYEFITGRPYTGY